MKSAKNKKGLFLPGFQYIASMAATNISRGVMRVGLTIPETELLMKIITHAILADMELNKDIRSRELIDTCETCEERNKEVCEMAYHHQHHEEEVGEEININLN
jgi:DNA-directed RNA polymerase specialized sigma subunit